MHNCPKCDNKMVQKNLLDTDFIKINTIVCKACKIERDIHFSPFTYATLKVVDRTGEY